MMGAAQPQQTYSMFKDKGAGFDTGAVSSLATPAPSSYIPFYTSMPPPPQRQTVQPAVGDLMSMEAAMVIADRISKDKTDQIKELRDMQQHQLQQLHHQQQQLQQLQQLGESAKKQKADANTIIRGFQRANMWNSLMAMMAEKVEAVGKRALYASEIDTMITTIIAGNTEGMSYVVGRGVAQANAAPYYSSREDKEWLTNASQKNSYSLPPNIWLQVCSENNQ